jgi:hypothetical protein
MKIKQLYVTASSATPPDSWILAPAGDGLEPVLRTYAETNFVQVLPLLALATAVAMNAIPSTPSSTVG